jgi:hypothetical protein
MTCFKSCRFDDLLCHNWNRVIGSSRKPSGSIPPLQMVEEADELNTRVGKCLCAEAVHLSAVYRTHLPCNHQYFLGAEQPVLTDEAKLVIRFHLDNRICGEWPFAHKGQRNRRHLLRRSLASAVHGNSVVNIQTHMNRNCIVHASTTCGGGLADPRICL